jgi:hypothetical protein
MGDRVSAIRPTSSASMQACTYTCILRYAQSSVPTLLYRVGYTSNNPGEGNIDRCILHFATTRTSPTYAHPPHLHLPLLHSQWTRRLACSLCNFDTKPLLFTRLQDTRVHLLFTATGKRPRIAFKLQERFPFQGNHRRQSVLHTRRELPKIS